MSKTVCVTGSEGFIGSHLVEELLSKGYNVHAIVLYNAFNSIGWLSHIPNKSSTQLRIFSGDLRNFHSILRAVRGADVMIHLGALISIPHSYESPEMYVDVNVKGTLNVLEAAKEAQLERLLIISSSEVYGTALYVPIDEHHPLQAQSPYSASKIGAEKMAEAYIKSFHLPACIVRPFNTYGPRQSFRAVIPSIIRQLVKGKLYVELGNLRPTRDFVYVKDLVRALMMLMHADGIKGEVVNVASGKEISIGDLAQKLVQIINPKAKVEENTVHKRPSTSEVYRLLGSPDKLIQLTNWKPLMDWDLGLRETVSWFRENEDLHLFGQELYHI